MSLDASWDKIDEYLELHKDNNEFITTECLAFATMAIGMWKITEQNIEKFYKRLVMWETVAPPLRTKGGDPEPFTYAEVARRIGLSTNASTLTDAQFKKKVHDMLERVATDKLAYGKHQLDKASDSLVEA